MNCTYRIVWSDVQQAFVAVAEIARARGKRSSSVVALASTTALGLLNFQHAHAQQAPPAAASSSAVAIASNALPVNGRVVSGTATISQSGNTLNIQQATQKLVTNWDSFNIGSSASVNFQQANASSVALNRVNSADPSYIFGSLTANGQVYLVNPSGIVFGVGSQVNVGGLVASSLALSDSNFLAGNNQFGTLASASAGGSAGYASGTGYVTNAGTIRTASGGYVAFIAPRIENTGSISTPQGATVLAAGDAVSLDFSGDKLINYTVTQGALNALIDNSGVIQADDGLVVMSARAADSLTRSVVNQSGIVEANSLTAKGGRVLLEGDDITLAAGSQTNATGATGGGEVLVGGDWQGGTWTGAVDMRHAITVTMASGASIDVSATQNGDGGKAVLWSDVGNASSVTTAQGRILARGVGSGNGGQIETSGHVANTDGADVNAGADQGAGGLWLIDPADSTITQSVANSYLTSLNNGTSVTNQVTGSITMSGVTLSKTGGGDATLTLQTATNSSNSGTLTLTNSTISSNSGKLNLVLNTDYNGGGYDSHISISGSTINTNGGNLWVGGGVWNGDWSSTGTANTLSANVSGTYVGTSTISTGAGSMTFNGLSEVTSSSNGNTNFGVWIAPGTSLSTTSGSISINGAVQGKYTNGMGVLIGGISATTGNTSIVSTSGAISVVGTAADASGSGTGYRHAIELLSNGTGDQTVLQSTSGAITLNGSATTSYSGGDSSGVQLQVSSTSGNIKVVSQTGNISLQGVNGSESSSSPSIDGLRLSAANAANSIRIGYDGSHADSGNITISSNSILQGNTNSTAGSISVQSSGTLSINPTGSSFTYLRAGSSGTLTFDNDWNFGTALSGFTLGSTANTSSITLGNAISVAGPINVYGGGITVNANLTTTAANAGILLESTGAITVAGSTTLQTNNGALTLWANSAGSTTAGGIWFGDSDTLNTANGSTSQTSGGGAITLGGGSNTGSVPTGASSSSSGAGISFGSFSAGTTVTSIYSGGGAISMRGATSNNWGVMFNRSLVMNAGNGAITLAGTSTGGNTGIELSGYSPSATTTVTAGGNISMTGSGTSGSGLSIGFGSDTITATGSASITVTGTTTSSSNYGIRMISPTLVSSSGAISLTGSSSLSAGGVYLTGAEVLSASGAIMLNGGSAGTTFAGTLGYLTGSAVTASSSNVTLTEDVLSVAGSTAVNTSGTLTVQPSSNSFASALSWPITNLTLASTVSGLTIGSSTNTANITIGSATSIAGPITVYGGTVTLSAALTTTNTSTGNIAITDTGLTGSGNISLASGMGLTVTQSGTSTYSGVISGSGATLTKAGSGTLVLSGADTYSGATTVSAGTLAVANATALGSTAGGVTVASGATLDLQNVAAGAEAVTLNGGTLLTSTGTSSLSGAVTLGADSNVSVTGTQLTLSGVVSGAYALTKAGSGTLSLTNANTYSGGTLLNGGTLGVYSNTAIGTGAFTVSGSSTLLLGRTVTSIANDITLNAALSVSYDTNVTYLIVGGGGSGAGNHSGAGGGGGAVVTGSTSAASGSYTVTVGAGGASSSGQGNNGGSSSLFSLTANGGGGGGTVATAGNAGASGGGGGAGNNSGGSGASGGSGTQGYGGGAGASNVASGWGLGGGGGGAGAAGSNASSTGAGSGGSGVASSITGTATYYGGGGGGGGWYFNSKSAGAGGAGGGGSGASGNGVYAGTAGTANTGGGGGGASADDTGTRTGGAGGSGIVIVSYLGSVAGSGGTVTSGSGTATGYTIHTFTSTGSSTLALNALATTFSGTVSGTGSLGANASGGTITLTGANTYSGATTVSAGTLAVANATALGSATGSTTVASGATLDLQSVAVGAEAVTLNGGTLLTSTGTSSLSGAVTLGANSNVSVTGTQLTLSGVVSGAYALTKAGSGTLVLSGANTYSGATTVSAGTLAVANATGLGSTAGGTTVASGATLDLQNVTIGAEAVTLNGSTLLTSTGTSSLSGAVTLGASSNVNVTGTQLTLSGVVSGAYALTKAGSGTLVLSGTNTYSGGTNLNAGVLNLGSSSAIGSSGTISFNGGTLQYSANNTSDYSARFSTAASQLYSLDTNGQSVTLASSLSSSGATLTKLGSGTLTLTANETYSGATTISGGALVLQNDAPTTGSSGFAGPGTLTVQSASASFGSAFSTSGWSLGSTLGGLTLGKSGNTASITVASAVSIAGPITVYGGAITVNAGLTATGTNTITLQGTGNVTDGANGYVSASNLLLSGGSVTLDNSTSNAIGTLAASGVSGLTFLNSSALTLGSVGSTNGVSATGVVSIGTASGDLTVAQNVATTNTTATALTLNAGISTNAGTSTGGNILVSGSPTVSVGTGGIAKLYSGSVSGSTGLAALVGGSGSGRFRYGSDETSTHYTQALSTGLNAIYREQPTVTVAINDQTMIYGATTPTWTFALTGGANGDTFAQAFASGPTVTVGGSTSTSGNYTAGTHTLSSGTTLTSRLGYAVSGSIGSGTLTVGQKALTYTGTSTSRDYDSTRTATLTNSASGTVTSDVVTISATSGTFDTANAGTGKTVSVAGIALGGADAANYSIATTVTLTNGVITPKTLTVSGLASSDKTYDGTTSASITNWGGVSTGVGSETLTVSGATASFASANVSLSGGVAQNQTVTATGLVLGNGSNGGLASNYQLSSTSATTSATITKAALTVTANNDAKFVTLADAVGYNGVSYSGFVNGETSSTAGLTGTVSISRSNSSNNNAGTYVLSASGLSANNYSISYVNGNYTIVPSNQLLVQVSNASMAYGTAATYSITSASYIDSSNVVHQLAPSGVVNNGSGNFTVSDGVGGSATFTLQPVNAGTSTSGQVVVGAYQLGATSVTTLNASNFSNTLTIVGAETVTQKQLSASASSGVSKTYDGTTNMNGVSLSLSGLIANDVATVNGSGAFASANAGTGLSYSISNLVLSGADAGNYYLQGGSFSGSNGVITPKTLTLSASKTYDGTTSLTGSSVTIGGLIGAQTLTYSGATASDAHVATSGKYISAITLANGTNGGLASNYQLPTLNASNVPVTITAATLTDTATIGGALTKVYDGTTSASGVTASIGNTFAGGVTGDSFNLTGLTLAYNSAHVAGATRISASGTAGFSIAASSSNSLASDYSFTAPSIAAVTATITPASLTASLSNTGVTKVYDGTTSAPTSFTAAYNVTGLVTGDTGATLTSTSSAYNSKDVLTANQIMVSGLGLTSVSGSNGSVASDYTLISSSASGSAAITAKTLSLSASKTYDGTTSLGSNALTLGGLVGSETLTYSSAAVNDAHVATSGKYISAITLANGTNGGLASNYQTPALNASSASNAVTITPATLTASLSNTGVTKPYDGTTSAPTGFTPTYNLTGFVSGDTAAMLTNTGAAYNSKDVVTANQVTVSGLAITGVTGSNSSTASDYQLSVNSANVSAAITAKTVSVAGLAANDKTYDGTTVVTVSNWGSVSGTVGSETLTLNPGTAAFNSANAAQGQTVTASGYSLVNGTNGGLASNYQLSGPATTTANILQAPLTVTANNDAKFVTLADNVGYNGVSYSGFVNGETSSVVGGTLSISRANSSTNSAGIYNGVLVASGLSANNYAISYVNGNYTIVPSNQLLVQVSNASTTYGTAATYSIASASYFDGSTVHQLSGVTPNGSGNFTVSDGVGGSATFTLTPTSAATASSGQLAVGAYQLGASGVTTQNAQNFSNTLTVVGAETVTQKAVSIAAAPSKVYDGTTGMAGTTLSGSGLVSDDAVTISGNGQYASRNVDTNVGYSFSNLALAGADAGNYYISGGNAVSGSNGTITPKALTLSAVSDTKTYDGTTTSNAAPQASGLVTGDTISGLLQLFDSSAVGTRTLGVSGYTINDGNGGNNYAVTLVASAGKINGTFSFVPPTIPTHDSTSGTNGNAIFPGNGTDANGSNGGSLINGLDDNGGTTMADNTSGGVGNSDGASSQTSDNPSSSMSTQVAEMAHRGGGSADNDSTSAASGSDPTSAASQNNANASGGASEDSAGSALNQPGSNNVALSNADVAIDGERSLNVVVLHAGRSAPTDGGFEVVEQGDKVKLQAHAANDPVVTAPAQLGRSLAHFTFDVRGAHASHTRFPATLTERALRITLHSSAHRQAFKRQPDDVIAAALQAVRQNFGQALRSVQTVFLDYR